MAAVPDREPHYTKIAEWVSECGTTGMEAAVYQHLAKRLHHASGSRVVDPSRARLAADVGLKKPDDVDPYLRALAALGAIVVHAAKGKRTKYELPLWPPPGYDGPANTYAADKWQREAPKKYDAWRSGRRAQVEAAEAPYAAKKRARVAKSAAKRRAAQTPDVPVATGRSEDEEVPVATGTHQPVAAGTHLPVATGTNQDDTNDQTNRGDGRRPTPGSGGGPGGGDAASDKSSRWSDERLAERARVADVRAVIQAMPGVLAALLNDEFPRGLPVEVTVAVEAALVGEGRTAQQVVDRIAARWVCFGYENDAMSATGKGIGTALGVLLELLSPSKCWGNNARCEDGTDLDTGGQCPRCVEARVERAASGAPDVPVATGTSEAEGGGTYTPPPFIAPPCEGAARVDPDLAQLVRQINRDRPRVPR